MALVLIATFGLFNFSSNSTVAHSWIVQGFNQPSPCWDLRHMVYSLLPSRVCATLTVQRKRFYGVQFINFGCIRSA